MHLVIVRRRNPRVQYVYLLRPLYEALNSDSVAPFSGSSTASCKGVLSGFMGLGLRVYC